MKKPAKKNFPVSDIRRFLEPGPIVLVSSRWKGRTNIMTMGWHTVMEFTPSLVGCVIAESDHSFEMIRKSEECAINIPETRLSDAVVGIGTCSGSDTDKFKKFNLTAQSAHEVEAPLIGECFANFECKLSDARLIKKYNFFIFEVVKAHVALHPTYPQTLHYRGKGIFTKSGKTIDLSKKFRQLKNM